MSKLFVALTWAVSRTACEELKMIGISNGLNYCVPCSFIIYTINVYYIPAYVAQISTVNLY